MRHTAFYGPLILLLWQTAPVTVRPDSAGRLRISLGYGAGGYSSDAEAVNCEGNVVERSHQAGQWRGPTVNVEAWPTRRIRVDVFTGLSTGSLQGSTGSSTTAFERRARGLLMAGEWSRVGLGAGVGEISGTERATRPLFYLRFGPLDSLHARFELAPSEPPADPMWLRASVGFNQGRRAGTRWVLGLAMGGLGRHRAADDEINLAASGELMVPIARPNLELRLSGRLGLGRMYHERIGTTGSYTAWGLGAGLRYSLGR